MSQTLGYCKWFWRLWCMKIFILLNSGEELLQDSELNRLDPRGNLLYLAYVWTSRPSPKAWKTFYWFAVDAGLRRTCVQGFRELISQNPKLKLMPHYFILAHKSLYAPARLQNCLTCLVRSRVTDFYELRHMPKYHSFSAPSKRFLSTQNIPNGLGHWNLMFSSAWHYSNE